MLFDQAGQPRPGRLRWFIGSAGILVVVYVTFSLADWMTFHPSVFPEGNWDYAASLHAEDVQLVASDGTALHAWFIASDVQPALARTIYLHGNAGNITHRILHIGAITQAGSDLLILDYRGYGKSAGSPSEDGLYLDAVAGYDWLTQRGNGEAPIVCYGESLGTAVATDLATRRPCSGLILEAPLPSRAAVAALVVPVIGPVLARGFETARKIQRVSSSLLVIHGSNDQVIPQSLGKQVFDAASEPKEFWDVAGAGHSDIVQVVGGEYVQRLSAFYRRLPTTGD